MSKCCEKDNKIAWKKETYLEITSLITVFAPRCRCAVMRLLDLFQVFIFT